MTSRTRPGPVVASLGALMLLCGTMDADAQAGRAVVRFRSYPVPVTLDTIARAEEIRAPYGAVYSTVRAVLADLDLRVTLDDTRRGVIGNLRWHRSGSVAGERPSAFLNCGAGPTGPNADNFRLTLAFAAFLDELGDDQTRLGVALIGEGENVTGTGGKPAACESLGVLETHILRLVRGRLGMP